MTDIRTQINLGVVVITDASYLGSAQESYGSKTSCPDRYSLVFQSPSRKKKTRAENKIQYFLCLSHFKFIIHKNYIIHST